MLAERKHTILRSIDSQGKLTPESAAAIEKAESIKWLEDFIRHTNPKNNCWRHWLASPIGALAAEIMSGSSAAIDLDRRAADFIDPNRQVNNVADVLLGVGHILAEDFSERADFRSRLRRILKKTGISSAQKPKSPSSREKNFAITLSSSTR